MPTELPAARDIVEFEPIALPMKIALDLIEIKIAGEEIKYSERRGCVHENHQRRQDPSL